MERVSYGALLIGRVPYGTRLDPTALPPAVRRWLCLAAGPGSRVGLRPPGSGFAPYLYSTDCFDPLDE